MSGGGMNYVTGGLKTVGGAVATYMGAPELGVPMMMSGVGQLAGQGAGGQSGGDLGSSIGGMVGGLPGMGSAIGGASGGLTGGMGAPGTGGLPSTGLMQAMQGSGQFPSWLDPSQVTGVSKNLAQVGGGYPSFLSGVGQAQGNPYGAGGGQPGTKPPSMLSQGAQALGQLSPAAQSIMGAMGMGQQKQPQQPPPTPPPPQMSAQKPNPQNPLPVPTPPQQPQGAGTQPPQGGGQPQAVGGPPSAGGGGQDKMQQLLAMLGLGGLG